MSSTKTPLCLWRPSWNALLKVYSCLETASGVAHCVAPHHWTRAVALNDPTPTPVAVGNAPNADDVSEKRQLFSEADDDCDTIGQYWCNGDGTILTICGPDRKWKTSAVCGLRPDRQGCCRIEVKPKLGAHCDCRVSKGLVRDSVPSITQDIAVGNVPNVVEAPEQAPVPNAVEVAENCDTAGQFWCNQDGSVVLVCSLSYKWEWYQVCGRRPDDRGCCEIQVNPQSARCVCRNKHLIRGVVPSIAQENAVGNVPKAVDNVPNAVEVAECTPGQY
jgi:hypothetical protein